MQTTKVRVKKQDVKVDNWVKPDPLETCLECWKIYYYGDGDRDLGVKTQSGLVGLKDAYGVDPAEEQQARDMRIGAATDAMIDSMKRIYIWAIYEMYSVANPWNFPNADLTAVGIEAKRQLTEKLKNNVATAILF